MVRSGEAIYAIPSTMVEQVRQVKAAEMDTLHHARQIEWQDNTYILHYLPHLLGDMEIVQENQPRNPVLLLRSGGQRIALRVDELLGNREAMVKNIGPQLARLSGIAGATVQGDGKVVLILNPVQLAQRIGGISKTKKASAKPLNSEPLIMVVDDSLTVRKITSRMLTRAGYQVVTATDGVDALEKLEEFTPDVMLLDIEMPRMDGFALARELRRDPRTQNLPIIMITSRTADKHRDYAMQLGVNTYLGKPYQEDELLQNIADFVAVHKLDA
jgi:chemosensory pili system protein ChpA (sensor histidine kinase/response regulator)